MAPGSDQRTGKRARYAGGVVGSLQESVSSCFRVCAAVQTMTTMRTLALVALLSALALAPSRSGWDPTALFFAAAQARDQVARPMPPASPSPRDLHQAYKQGQRDLKAVQIDIAELRRDLKQRTLQITNLRTMLRNAYDNALRTEALARHPFAERPFAKHPFPNCSYVFPQNLRYIELVQNKLRKAIMETDQYRKDTEAMERRLMHAEQSLQKVRSTLMEQEKAVSRMQSERPD
jgi:septal ring factor EnvC (AmiA/AmiB activator)